MKADEDFLRDLNASFPAVMKVAIWLRAHDQNVNVMVPTIRKDSAERWKHTDSGDIEILKTIEVKHRGFDFHDMATFPHPTIWIGETYKVDKGLARLHAFVATNKAITHAAVVPASTKAHWLKETRYDAKQGRECESYGCPKGLATFIDLRK
jgi:hypothetical protein